MLPEFRSELLAMGTMLLGAAFFSGAEAALFFLRRQDRRAFRDGDATQRLAVALLDAPERLLLAMRFWGLFFRVAYFTLASVIFIRLSSLQHTGEAVGLVSAAILVLVIGGELLPKSLAARYTREIAWQVSWPMAAAVRVFAPLERVLRVANIFSLRLLCPNLKSEPLLELADLEQAIQLSTSDVALLEQEQTVFTNIVSLSEIRIDELMRPRTGMMLFNPPVSWASLKGQVPPSGYLLIAEPSSEELAAAIPLQHLSDLPNDHLERHAVPVLHIPWCTSVALALEQMRDQDRRVVAVINEFGETIGVVTLEDILATIFTVNSSRSQRLLKTSSIREVAPGVWHVTGITSRRRIEKMLNVELPRTQNVTVAGVLQDELQRLPQAGDTCLWGPFSWKVLQAPQRGHLMVELTRVDNPAEFA